MGKEGINMKLKNELDIIRLMEEDPWIMEILHVASTLQLPDWWICAGFVRSKIWDALHGFRQRTPMQDIDVIYFDPLNIDEMEEKKYEAMLKKMQPHIPWSVKNQARMHVINDLPPYSSSVDAISKFPETVTSLGLKLSDSGEVELTAPCGIEDVLAMEVHPTPYFKETEARMRIYKYRIKKKNWTSIWYKVKVK
jgi:uncharacterized protein